MMVYPPDVLTEKEARRYISLTSHRTGMLTDRDFDILFARHGLLFTGWHVAPHDTRENVFYAEVYPL
jgi:hypothetical protein